MKTLKFVGEKILDFISEWVFRIIISPILLLMLLSNKKRVFEVGDVATWKGSRVKITKLYDYAPGIPVVDFEMIGGLLPMHFTAISLKELS